MIQSFRFRYRLPVRPWALLGVALWLGACDRAKAALSTPMTEADPAWVRDSTLVAKGPSALMRVVRTGNDTRVIPIATVFPTAFRALTMSDRGWRLLDLRLLHSDAKVTPLIGGRPLAAVSIRRGMWEGAPLDTVDGCTVMPPAASAAIPAGAQLVVAGTVAPAPNVSRLTSAARADALLSVVNLVAPAAGVPPSIMRRYRQEVSVVATGSTKTETIVVTFDDPASLPDSLSPYGQRPRHVIVVLDKGIYGYKPTYLFKSVGNRTDRARRKFLGAVDTDGNGVAELFFGAADPEWPLVTYALEWEVDVWQERFKYERSRCHG